MKAILISIAPEWCSQIVLGDKTMEVRKTRPRMETPFKVYIYCSKAKNKIGWVRMCPGGGWQRLDGSVIGEFICDEIRRVHIPCPTYQNELDKLFITESCMSYNALHNYCPDGDAYFWHISNLHIYPEPVDLKDFWGTKPCGKPYDCCACEKWDNEKMDCDNLFSITRPPQSWCYVEEP